MRSDGAGPRGEESAPFVERRTYRRRRLMDIAKLLPVFGALLFALPLLWPGPGAGPEAAGKPMSSALIYLFSVWAGLIALGFVFSLAVRRWAGHWTAGQGQDAPGGADAAGSPPPEPD